MWAVRGSVQGAAVLMGGLMGLRTGSASVLILNSQAILLEVVEVNNVKLYLGTDRWRSLSRDFSGSMEKM